MARIIETTLKSIRSIKTSGLIETQRADNMTIWDNLH